MPESVAVISLSRQLQLLHAASSTLETAGIYLAAPENFFGEEEEGREQPRSKSSLICSSLIPALLAFTHKKAATHFPLLSKDLTAETGLHYRFFSLPGTAAARWRVSVITPTNRGVN